MPRLSFGYPLVSPLYAQEDEFALEFAATCYSVASRYLWSIRAQASHVSREDIAQDAVLLLWTEPERFATDPIAVGAHLAVQRVVTGYQGSKCRRKGTLDLQFAESVEDLSPPDRIEFAPTDRETDANRLSHIVGTQDAVLAELVSSDVSNAVSCEILGVSESTLLRKKRALKNRLFDEFFGSLAVPLAVALAD